MESLVTTRQELETARAAADLPELPQTLLPRLPVFPF